MEYPLIWSDVRPEAMADVPGVCELPLTRAVVFYRDVHEVGFPGGRIEDIGMGLVLEGRYPASAQTVDLGSGRLKTLDLSTELVVLDWVYAPTLEYVREVLARDPVWRERGEAEDSFRPYLFDLALRILQRAGYGPLTRPVILRLGFRDVCRDLDLHEGTAVRVVLGPGRLVRATMEYEANTLLFRTAFQEPEPELEEALARAFPDREIRRCVPRSPGASLDYQVRFPLPLSFSEARELVAGVRAGLVRLLALLEPDRLRALKELTGTFGVRDTLARLPLRDPPVRFVTLSRPTAPGAGTVH